jgi:cytochrome c-type biogenesis protein CcmF
MIPIFGFGILVITFIVSLYGAGAALYGGRFAKKNAQTWVESARSAMLLTFPLTSLAVVVMIFLLLTRHYEVQFVYSVTSDSMPAYLKMTALWGGQSGSLLFWSWLMSGFAAAATLRKWERDREFLPWVIVATMVTLAFFIGLTVFVQGQIPFERFWQVPSGDVITAVFQPAGSMPLVPADGAGLNPLLRHFGMIIHPPMLYLGFVAFVIPFAFGFASLVTGRTDDRWIRVTRRWTLVAWLFLSLGLILGMRWAYDVLGWGGYWSWDPVELAALIPWLSGTAFLHSVMIQEKRGLFKRWNLILVILTYCLVIYGTFLTRSGVFSSVHAFSESSIGPLFFGFIGITFLICLGLLLYRWNDLRSESQMTSLLSRESLFLVNNLLFMGILVVCFWGMTYPLISELFTGQKVTVGPPFYTRATGPLFGALFLLMGVAPLSAWGHSTLKTYGRAIWKPLVVSLAGPVIAFAAGVRQWTALLAFWLSAFVVAVTLYEYGRAALARHNSTNESLLQSTWRLAERNRRRYGGYIIHLAVVMMGLGIIGMQFFQTQTQGTLKQGETLTLDNYTITFKDLWVFDTPNNTLSFKYSIGSHDFYNYPFSASDGRNVAMASVTVSQNGQLLTTLYPRRDYYYESQQPVTVEGLRSTLADDLYIVLVDWQPISSGGTTFKVYHNPLVIWLWIGGFVFILGTLVAAWPDREAETVRQPALEPAVVKA